MPDKTHLGNQFDEMRTEEDMDFSGFDEILLWNQDFIRIKERVQQSVRIGKTFETLDKKTKIAFKIPMWIMYLKCKTKQKIRKLIAAF